MKSLFDNEILEVLYITKVKFLMEGKNLFPLFNDGEPRDNSPGSKVLPEKSYRQFLIRRKKHLEVMYTNGLNFWTEMIEGS